MGSSLDGVGALVRARLWGRGEFSARPELWTAGQLIAGQYRLVERLGFGALGEVFLAWDEWLEREVALKGFRLRDERAQDERWARLFERDALATARLDHAHIVKLYQFGFHGVRPFLVLERLRGQTLAALLRHPEPISRARKLRWLEELAEALAHAHARGVVHRDLKPSNLFIGEDDRLKVLDFGLAVVGEPSFASGDALGWTVSMVQDELGTLPARTGTPQYMAPEQREGRAQDQRVDVWAFGTIAAELLAGALPDARAELEQLPAREGALGALILRCLAPERDERPAGFEEVLLALRGEAIPARVWGARREEERALIQAIEAGRLVSLVGPRGVGKTALARRLVDRSWRAIARVCWCEEVPAHEALLVSIHRALGLTIERQPVVEQVAEALREARTLVVLDCDQLRAEQVAEALAALKNVPELCLLHLNERPLGLEHEHIVRVGPLGGELPEDTERLLEHGQARLFLALARRHSQDLEVRAADLGALHRVLRQLGGLPIALEVAAAQLGNRTLAELADALEDGQIELLHTSRQDPARGLHHALEQAWRSLQHVAREVACQLSAFEVPCSLNELTAVVDVPGLEEGLAQLIDRSIVQCVDDGRMTMLAPIRRFVHERARERALRWPLWTPGRPVAGLAGAPHRLALLRASTTRTTSKHALYTDARRALASQDVRLAAFLCAALLARLDDQGMTPEWEHLAQTLLTTHTARLPEVLRAELLVRLGESHSARARYAEALECWHQAQTLDARHGSRVRKTRATALAAMIALRGGEHAQAERLTQEAVALAEAIGDDRAQLIALSISGVIATIHAPEQARLLLREAVVLAERLDDGSVLARLLCNLGLLELRSGRLRDAREQLVRAVVLCETAGLRVAEVSCRGNLGWLALRAGRWDEALSHMTRAERQADELGMRYSRAVWRGGLAVIDLVRGAHSRAHARLTDALRFGEEVGERYLTASWRMELGRLEMERHRFDEAEALLREAVLGVEAVGERPTFCLIHLGHLLICLERFEEAREILDRAAALAALEVNTSVLAEVFVCQALSLTSQGQHAEAEALLARVPPRVEEMPLSATAGIIYESLRVVLARRAGRYEVAAAALAAGQHLVDAVRPYPGGILAAHWARASDPPDDPPARGGDDR